MPPTLPSPSRASMNTASRFTLRSLLVAMSVAASFPGSGGAATGDCSTSFYTWSPPTTSTTTGPASAPAQDTSFNPDGKSYSYFSQGTTLFAVRNVAEPGCTLGDCIAGGIKWTWQATPPSTLQNFPSPVPLSQSAPPELAESIFLAGE